MIRRIGLALLAPVIALAFAVGVASIVLLLVDVNPLDAFRLMWDFAATSTSVASIINRAIPLYVSAVAVADTAGEGEIGVEPGRRARVRGEGMRASPVLALSRSHFREDPWEFLAFGSGREAVPEAVRPAPRRR